MHQEPLDQQMTGHSARRALRLGYDAVLLEYGLKRPAFRDWTERFLTLNEVTFWTRRRAFGLGVFLGDRLAVVDRDALTPETDDWLQAHGLDKPRFSVRTSKGVHSYWRLPAAVKEVRSRIRVNGLPIDLLMGKRVAVFPPTWIRDTDHRYAIAPGSQLCPSDALSPLPDAVVAVLNADPPGSTLHPRIAPIPGSSEPRLLRYVERIDRSEMHRGGSTALVRACLKILTLVDGSLERAWPLVLHYNRTRCVPPWDEEAGGGPDSLRRKLLVAKFYRDRR